MRVCCSHLVLVAILWTMSCTRAAVAPTNITELNHGIDLSWRNRNSSDVPHSRRKRYVSSRDMTALLDYHNRVRSQVFPPAANMEYMVWDDKLAKSAESWASQCIWDHGPPHVMRYTGQNLSISTGKYKSVIDLVKSWNDEKFSFSYPNRCTGPVCTHYTQSFPVSSVSWPPSLSITLFQDIGFGLLTPLLTSFHSLSAALNKQAQNLTPSQLVAPSATAYIAYAYK
ncbi:Peptidase inhibitor 15 [Bagarius yarrelli]|uniref:Peptidase inhibitor 15 n=1 Tax=Bagarius yarrelli TaxID=175774 RepID=A0A556U0H6_BAGYA|nr:Peptidase inhibitor 15 [Bagarius yarrelli]